MSRPFKRGGALAYYLGESRRGDDECWNWAGYIGKNGYPYLASAPAYRAVWLHLVGPVPIGYEMDHLCRNPRCVNPKHLEPVPPRVNNMRSNSAAAIQARKTHCKHGHPFDEDNTFINVRKNGRPDRRCKRCHMLRARSHWKHLSVQEKAVVRLDDIRRGQGPISGAFLQPGEVRRRANPSPTEVPI